MSIKTLGTVGLACILSVLAGVGCGSSDDDKPAGAEGTPNKQGASSATTATITATQSAIKPSSGGTNAGQASANQLSSAAQATQNLVTPAAGTAAKSLPGLDLAGILHPLENPAGTTGTCNCTADSCTFAACTTGALTIDGTYAFGGGKIKTSDLKYTIKAGAGGVATDVVINVAADLTVTATSINGTFQSTGTSTSSVGGQSYSSEWDSALEFKNVTYPSGGGAPTAGSVHVTASSSINAGGQSQAFHSDFDVNFPGG